MYSCLDAAKLLFLVMASLTYICIQAIFKDNYDNKQEWYFCCNFSKVHQTPLLWTFDLHFFLVVRSILIYKFVKYKVNWTNLGGVPHWQYIAPIYPMLVLALALYKNITANRKWVYAPFFCGEVLWNFTHSFKTSSLNNLWEMRILTINLRGNDKRYL